MLGWSSVLGKPLAAEVNGQAMRGNKTFGDRADAWLAPQAADAQAHRKPLANEMKCYSPKGTNERLRAAPLPVIRG